MTDRSRERMAADGRSVPNAIGSGRTIRTINSPDSGHSTVQAILHHELHQDMRSACQHIVHYHKLLPASAVSQSSSVMVVTPEKIPDT
jgi:hypothetical protein